MTIPALIVPSATAAATATASAAYPTTNTSPHIHHGAKKRHSKSKHNQRSSLTAVHAHVQPAGGLARRSLYEKRDEEDDDDETEHDEYEDKDQDDSSTASSSASSGGSDSDDESMNCSTSSYDSNYTDTSCCTLLDQLEDDPLLLWPPSRPSLLSMPANTENKNASPSASPSRSPTNTNNGGNAQRRMLMKTNVSRSTRSILTALTSSSTAPLSAPSSLASSISMSASAREEHDPEGISGRRRLLAEQEENEQAVLCFESFLKTRQDASEVTTYIQKDPTRKASLTHASSASSSAVVDGPEPHISTQHHHPDSPQATLQALLTQACIPYSNITTIPSTFWKAYFVPVTPARRAAYTHQAAQAVRSQDLETLQHMITTGQGNDIPPSQPSPSSLDACNDQGESLIHHACRRHNLPLIRLLVHDAQVSLKVQDDCGKTALHECCWAVAPAFLGGNNKRQEDNTQDDDEEEEEDCLSTMNRVTSCSQLYQQQSSTTAKPNPIDTTDIAMMENDSIHGATTNTATTNTATTTNTNANDDWWNVNLMVLQACPELMWCPDERGHTPLQYVPQESWSHWNDFLTAHSEMLQRQALRVRFQVAKFNLKHTLERLD